MADSISYPVEIPVDGRTIPGYLAEPQERGRHPGVVVIQDRWGMVDHH